MPTASTSRQLEPELGLLRFVKANNYLPSSAVATITVAERRGTLLGPDRLIDFS